MALSDLIKFQPATSNPGSWPLLFWPFLILLLGFGPYALAEVLDRQDQLHSLTQAVHELEPKVKWARYEQAKVYAVAMDVLHLASTDSNAARIVAEFKIHSNQAGQATATAATNAAPVNPPGIKAE